MAATAAPERDGQGIAGLTGETLAGVVTALWWEAHPTRLALHRLRGVDRCDVLMVAGSVRLGPGTGRAGVGPLLIAGECVCRDYLVDMLVEADRYLSRVAAPIENPAGAVRRHIRTRANGDWTRQRRTAMGAQARTDRIRTGVRARELPTGRHRALLEYLVDEAGSLAPLESDGQLHRRLAERLLGEFGGSVETTLSDVLAMLPVVESACRSGPRSDPGDGRQLTWWERYVEHPLGRRTRRGDVEVDAAREMAARPGGAPEDPVSQRETVLDVLLGLPRRDLTAGVRTTVLDLARRGAMPTDVAGGFVADPIRVGVVVSVLRSRDLASREPVTYT